MDNRIHTVMRTTCAVILLALLSPMYAHALGTFGHFSQPEQNNFVAACAVAAGAQYMRIYRTDDLAFLAPPLNLPSAEGVASAFSKDGRFFAFGLNASPWVMVYNTSNWSLLTNLSGLTGVPNALAFNNSGTQLAVVSSVAPAIAVYNTSNWTSVLSLNLTAANPSQSVSFNPADTLMAVGSNTNPVTGFLTVFNTTNWTPVGINSSPTVMVRDVEFNKLGDLAVAGGSGAANSFLSIYLDGTIGSNPPSSTSPNAVAYSVAFKPDGSRVVVGVLSGIKIYDPLSLGTIPTSVGMTGAGTVNSVSFSNKGEKLVAATSAGSYLYVFESTAWGLLTVASLPGAACKGAAFTP